MLKRFLVLSMFLVPLTGSTVTYAQRMAVNNNALFDLTGALSAGVEVPLSKKQSFEVYGSLRPWKRGQNSVHKHWLVQAQYRLWPCQVMNGFFFGPYAHVGEFNLGNKNLCLGLLKGLKPYRYEGTLAGVGLGAGYEYVLTRHLNLGAEIGVGYTYIKYKKYDCEVCGSLKKDDKYNYVGISRAALSLIYVF